MSEIGRRRPWLHGCRGLKTNSCVRFRADDAIKVFTLGLLLDLQDKDYAIACQFIAETYKQLGKNDMAVLYAQKAARKDPDNKIVRALLDGSPR